MTPAPSGTPAPSLLHEQAAPLRPVVRAVIACVLKERPDHPDVEDCTNEALRRAFESKGAARGPSAQLRPLTRKVLRNPWTQPGWIARYSGASKLGDKPRLAAASGRFRAIPTYDAAAHRVLMDSSMPVRSTRLSFQLGGVSALALALATAVGCSLSSENEGAGSSDLSNGEGNLSKPVSPTVASGPAVSDQSDPALAFDGKNFLAVWTGRGAVSAARISQDGEVLDERSLVLGASVGKDGKPRVAFDGKNFIAVWLAKEGIRAARIGTDGKLLDANPISIGGATAQWPAVAWNGKNYLVTWTDRSSNGQGWDVFSALVGADGQVAGDAGGARLASSSTNAKPSRTSVAAVGSTFFVAWDEQRPSNDVYGIRVGGEGKALDDHPLPLGQGSAFRPSAVSRGTELLVTWENAGAQGFESRGLRVSAAGEVLDAAPVTLAALGKDGLGASFWDGDAYVVVGGGSLKRFAADLTAVGNAVTVPESKNVGQFAVAASSSSYFVLVQKDASTASKSEVVSALEGSFVSRALGGAAKPLVYPARTDATQRNIVAATDGTDHLVVWEDLRTDWFHPEIWGAIYRADGTLASPNGFRIAASADAPLTMPSVVFDGSDYVVAWDATGWQNGPRVYGITHVSTKGVVEASSPKGGSVGDRPQLVGGNGFIALVSGQDVYTDLSPLSVRTFKLPKANPVVTYNGSELVAAWVDGKKLESHYYSKAGIEVGTGASLAVGAIKDLTLASDDKGNTLLAWAPDGQSPAYVWGARVASSGAIDTKPVALLSKKSASPTAIYDGSRFLVGYDVTQLDNAGKIKTTHPEVAFFDVTQAGLEQNGAPIVVGSEGDIGVRLATHKGLGALVTYGTPTTNGVKRAAMRDLTYTRSAEPSPTASPTGTDTNSGAPPSPSGSASAGYDDSPPPMGDGYESDPSSSRTSSSRSAKNPSASNGCATTTSTGVRTSSALSAYALVIGLAVAIRRRRRKS